MAAAIRASATLDRHDRLFPGHPEQFTNPAGGLSVAYGAAGVLYALHATGAAIDPLHEAWLVQHATNAPRVLAVSTTASQASPTPRASSVTTTR